MLRIAINILPRSLWVFFSALFIFVGSSPPQSVKAYSVGMAEGTSGGIIRWYQTDVTYTLHPACSSDLPASTCLNEVRASFDQWSASCSALNFNEVATNATKQLTSIGYASNDKNEVAWIEDSQWVFGEYVLGVTAPYFGVPDGDISEADIAFNGYLHTWTINGPAYSTDVMNVAVHEIGHFFGMQHVLGGYDGNNPPTMAPQADSYLKSQTPEADDLAGLCFLYPAGTFTCASNDDCPTVIDDGPNGEYYAGQLACQNGNCGGVSNEIPVGSGTIGDDCTGPYDCGDPYFCQSLDGSNGVCASECDTSSANCPLGYECVPYANAPEQGVCLEESGSSGGSLKGIGETCESSYDCESQLCILHDGQKVCRQPCLSDANCPMGESCYDIPGNDYGACAPDDAPDTSGPLKATGQPCQSGSECESELCAGDSAGYACTQTCSSSAQCPEGYQCLGLSGGGGGCFETDSNGLGEICDHSGECASGLCADFGDGIPICSDYCQTHSDCPCGMACDSYTDGDYCVPGPKIACVPEGAECTDSSECTSGTCYDGICLETCSILLGSGACPAGETCQRLDANGIIGKCQPMGPNENGSACGQDNACQSLFCHEWFCQQPCSPYGANTCDMGQVCESLSQDIGICITPEPEPEQPRDDGRSGDGTTSGDGSTGTGNSSGTGSSDGVAANRASIDGSGGSTAESGDSGESSGSTETSSVSPFGCHGGRSPVDLWLWTLMFLTLLSWTRMPSRTP